MCFVDKEDVRLIRVAVRCMICFKSSDMVSSERLLWSGFRRLSPVAGARGGTPIHRAPRAHRAVACVLVGARSAAELEDNLELARHPIPRAFWETLRVRRLVDPAAPLPGDDE